MRMRIGSVGLGLLALAAAAAVARAEDRLMSVQVRQGPVRAAPSFLGQVVGDLAYGDRVRVLEQRPGWMKVSAAAGGVAGWMHASALTEKRVVLKSGTADAQGTASGEELALAGKGFNADVEAEFKARNRDADFAAVDRMEKRNATAREIAAFVADGVLRPREGGAR
jgi:hypothetical protein